MKLILASLTLFLSLSASATVGADYIFDEDLVTNVESLECYRATTPHAFSFIYSAGSTAQDKFKNKNLRINRIFTRESMRYEIEIGRRIVASCDHYVLKTFSY